MAHQLSRLATLEWRRDVLKLESTESEVKIIEIILGERHQVKTLRGEC